MSLLTDLQYVVATLGDPLPADYVAPDYVDVGYVVAPSGTAPVFAFGDKGYKNLMADAVDTSNGAIYLDWPLNSKDAMGIGGAIAQSFPLNLYFFRKSPLDATPAQHQTLLDPLRGLVYRFVNAARVSGRFQEFKTAPIKWEVFDHVNLFDRNTTGCVLAITLTPVKTVTC